jgi:hypothetical protein
MSESNNGRADDRSRGFGGVSQLLGLDTDPMELLVARSVTEVVRCPSQLAPEATDETAEGVSTGLLGIESVALGYGRRLSDDRFEPEQGWSEFGGRGPAAAIGFLGHEERRGHDGVGGPRLSRTGGGCAQEVGIDCSGFEVFEELEVAGAIQRVDELSEAGGAAYGNDLVELGEGFTVSFGGLSLVRPQALVEDIGVADRSQRKKG